MIKYDDEYDDVNDDNTLITVVMVMVMMMQIEVFRSSSSQFSLGVKVIVGVKKVRTQSTKFLLRGDFDGVGGERWTPLKRAADKNGKPFRLLRKVAI